MGANVVLTRMSGGLAHGHNKARQHSLDFAHSRVQRLKLLWHEKIQIFSQENEILQLAGGFHCDVKKLAEFGICSPPATLGDICGNREGGSSHLAGESKHVLPRKNARSVIQAHSRSVTFFPSLQFGVVLYSNSFRGPKGCYYYRVLSSGRESNCRLRTENCEPSRGAGHAR
jgi:hypothetical protein